ncbi:MAG: Ribulose-phosphate 3-epimerase [Candidatus Giovannonibacteria bacterium GW2011_GWA2_53_7]|uniref:Ribulose-phosphate 3-epimerase n=1 Tax=Candidatus Giovannonibacteria bacterium GW2011_GWA2_53_7 TaxID=1618650 RepID=A0A0G2A3F4_9BACT|nr:MAG: Ribulose-phosphate 3-epimerase [Candidatus Giovannonibacteria bacterium GW2011_GWA2_53_7]
MIEIIPAIMPDSYEDLIAKVSRVQGNTNVAQIDIMDGAFVVSRSWPYSEGGTRAEPHFAAMITQDEGLPFWDSLDYEIDLMIARPEDHIGEWLPLGASRLIFHIEAIRDIEKFFASDLFVEGAREIGGETVIEIGLAINPDTPISTIEPYVDRVDFVQVMGIAKIGYQGQPFDERVLTQINQLRVAHPSLIISVDGGVNEETVKLLADVGADRLVAGSAIFGKDDIGEAIADLQSLVPAD